MRSDLRHLFSLWVGAVTAFAAFGDVDTASAESRTPSSRLMVRLAPDVIVRVDAEGGFWVLPDPTVRRLTFADVVGARRVRDDLHAGGVADLRRVFEARSERSSRRADFGLDRWISIDCADPDAALAASSSLSLVRDAEGILEVVEIDGWGGVAAPPPDDAWFDRQYGLRNTGQPIGGVAGTVGSDVGVLEAWNWSIGSPDVTIAVLDSGFDQHEEFASRLLPGRNVPDGTSDVSDECGSHGTHVAGILAAEGGNGFGIAGVTWRSRILPVVVTDGCTGLESWVAEGIVWAVDEGADVINMSLQYATGGTLLADAVAYAHAAGVVQIASAGNTGDLDDVQAPARFPETIAVAATDNRDRRWSSSSGGPEVDLAAPGHQVYACLGNSSYGYRSGTSMSAPFVSGAVAILRSLRPDLDVEEIRGALRSTAEDVEASGFDVRTGAGRLDLGAAVLAIEPPQPAIGDIDRDGRVDGRDFGEILVGWGPCPDDCEAACPADLNGDCRVDGVDLGTILQGWTG